MIPSTNHKLLVAEDWKKIYQTYRNADFTSYDFETIRRTMISYLQEKYPEDFNDYIDSSEYIALVDLIAFISQNLSFRIDLNARENFLETAERRESVIRLARLINYNVKRNSPAHGFLKIAAVQTTDNVIDASGVNLSGRTIGWNDSTNVNWYQQYVTILNSAMPGSFVFGVPFDRAVIDGISTEQYKINSSNTDVPIYSFNRSINGTAMDFDITGSAFSESTYIYEDVPVPGKVFSMIYKNDGRGAGSANTGFFVQFRQGTLKSTNFTISNPVPNEVVGIDAPNINDSDVWLWQLDTNGNYSTLWNKVSTVSGNNVIYNNLNVNKRNIYAVITRENDQIDLNFADGAFGNLPVGTFGLFYRQSNAKTYSIKPDQMRGIQVQIPYRNKIGQTHTLSLTLSLQYTVDNSTGAESNENIKIKAPQSYYTQNRMVTAEDYNISPLNAGTDILRIKSVNRVSSGISKYYELSDVSGKYSSTNIFATDGALYKDYRENIFEFTFTGRNEIYSVVTNQLVDIISSNSLKSLYYDRWPRPGIGAEFGTQSFEWVKVTKTVNQTTGYIRDVATKTPQFVGYYASNNLQYFYTNALVKITAPTLKYFKTNGELITSTGTVDPSWTKTRWIKVLKVISDGANAGKGTLSDGTGPIILSENVPTGALITEMIPEFSSTLPTAIQSELVNLCLANRNFGLSFATDTRTWFIISDTNLDLNSPLSVLYQKDVTNNNKDASWLVSFEWTGINYRVHYRVTDYIFESENQTAFFFDPTSVNFDFVNNTVIKDQIKILKVNSNATSTYTLNYDYNWQVDNNITEADGYQDPKKIKVSFYTDTEIGKVENPDAFNLIVSPSSISAETGYRDKFVYFQLTSSGQRYAITSSDQFLAFPSEEEARASAEIGMIDGQLYYFYNELVDVIKQYNSSTDTFDLCTEYYAKPGRKDLKFQYRHNSGDDRRLDPSKTNIIDVYVLNKAYDLSYRNWISGMTDVEPLPPTSSALEENYSSVLEPIKTISDELVFHPVIYKPLFGKHAPTSLQAVFKVVKNSNFSISDNDIKTKVLTAIENFFALENWDFGQTFHFSELSTYIMNSLTPNITNFVIVPVSNSTFGSLYEISSQTNEIFINAATTENIEIVDAITSTALKTTSTIVTSSTGV